MTSVSAWCEMMQQFLDELESTLPEEKGISYYKQKYDLVRKTNPRVAVEKYMARMGPYSQQLMSKDEKFFLDDCSEEDGFIDKINLRHHWKSGTLSANTKDAIWQYLQTLYVLGTTITAIPQDALNMIEDVANKCAQNMQNGEGGIDQKALMDGMGGLFSSLSTMMQNPPTEKK